MATVSDFSMVKASSADHRAVSASALRDFLPRFQKQFSFDDISRYFGKIKNFKVLVIGETIIDEYHYVRTMNKSPKEALVATRYENEEAFAGGVLACANHIASYCEKVDVLTCLGKTNSQEQFIRRKLKRNVTPKLFYHPTAPTIVKRRFLELPSLRKMFEVYYFDDRPTPASLEKKLLVEMKKTLPQYDLVIVIDYGHGFLTPKLREGIAKYAKFLALNTQTNSANFGFHVVTKYPRADYVCIDHLEARLAFREQEVPSLAAWKPIVQRVARELHAKRAIVTLGHEGCLSYDGKRLHRVPVLSTNVLDRVGAGDAFLAITSPLARAGMPAEALGFVGNAVGALAIKILGNKESVEPIPLLQSMREILSA